MGHWRPFIIRWLAPSNIHRNSRTNWQHELIGNVSPKSSFHFLRCQPGTPMPSCIADGLVIFSSLSTHLKVIGSSILALYATITTSEKAGLWFISFVTKMFHPEQPERVADLSARAIIHTRGENRSMARLGRLGASGLHQLLSLHCRNWGVDGAVPLPKY